jgi:hypothetical protein
VKRRPITIHESNPQAVHLSRPALQRLVVENQQSWCRGLAGRRRVRDGDALPGTGRERSGRASMMARAGRGHNSAYFGVAAGEESGRPATRVHPRPYNNCLRRTHVRDRARGAAGRTRRPAGFGGRVCRARAKHAGGVSFSPFPVRPPPRVRAMIAATKLISSSPSGVSVTDPRRFSSAHRSPSSCHRDATYISLPNLSLPNLSVQRAWCRYSWLR